MPVSGDLPKKPVPALSARTLDGKPIKLSDYRGKCVVLVFWAPWAPPAPEAIAALKTAGNAADPRLAMIGVALEDKPDGIKGYTQSNSLKWTDVQLEGRDKTTASETWAVNTLPMIFLIDSNGSILARDLKASRLGDAIEGLLKTTN